MELHQLLPDFRMNSFESIESMVNALLRLEAMPGCCIAINDLFHSIRNLKESASLFGLDEVVTLSGEMENALVLVYRGELASDEPLITLLLSCCAHMRTLIGQTNSDWTGRAHLTVESAGGELLSQLKNYQLEHSSEQMSDTSLYSPPGSVPIGLMNSLAHSGVHSGL